MRVQHRFGLKSATNALALEVDQFVHSSCFCRCSASDLPTNTPCFPIPCTERISCIADLFVCFAPRFACTESIMALGRSLRRSCCFRALNTKRLGGDTPLQPHPQFNCSPRNVRASVRPEFKRHSAVLRPCKTHYTAQQYPSQEMSPSRICAPTALRQTHKVVRSTLASLWATQTDVCRSQHS